VKFKNTNAHKAILAELARPCAVNAPETKDRKTLASRRSIGHE